MKGCLPEGGLPVRMFMTDEAGAEARSDEGAAAALAGAGEAAADDVEDILGEDPYPDIPKEWYVIHTYSGYEKKVKANLERRVASMGMEGKIFRILVPVEEEIDFKEGKKRIVTKRLFPGYVLVEMVLSDDSWYVVRNTPGVTGFVGAGNRPIPLDKEEVRAILLQMGYREPRPRVPYEVGETVRVIAGPFANFTGRVEEVNPERGRLRVIVSMFGRDTPVEFTFNQVEKTS